MSVERMISAPRIMRHVRAITSFGPRVDGTQASRNAAGYVAKYLRECGCRVDLMPISFPVVKGLKCTLSVAPDGPVVPCLPNTRSALTHGPLEREAVFVDVGLDRDYEGRHVANKIVFAAETSYWQGSNLPATKYYRAIGHEAAGFVFSDRRNDEAITCWTMSPGIAPSPTVSIPYSSYAALKARAAKNGGLKVSLRVTGKVERSVDYIVAGTMKGRRRHAGSVYIDGSHHETVAHCPGANDNASGIAVMLELARFLSSRQLDQHIVFLSTCAEECACYGIDRYLRTKRKGLAKAKASFVIDQIGGGNAGIIERGIAYDEKSGLVPTNTYYASDKTLVQALMKSARRFGYHLPVYRQPAGGFGEAGSFAREGVPSVFLCGWNTDIAYHTSLDGLDKISANGLKPFAEILADTILRGCH